MGSRTAVDRAVLTWPRFGDATIETLALVRNVIRPQVADSRCAVLYQKGRSVPDCEYVWQHTDLWINFPWSFRPPVAGPATDA
jgi:uncharacterized protein